MKEEDKGKGEEEVAEEPVHEMVNEVVRE